MNQFWPPRRSPKGFSIESLAKKYRQRLSKQGLDIKDNLEHLENQIIEKNDLIDFYHNEMSKVKSFPNHWANRDFEEYRKAA